MCETNPVFSPLGCLTVEAVTQSSLSLLFDFRWHDEMRTHDHWFGKGKATYPNRCLPFISLGFSDWNGSIGMNPWFSNPPPPPFCSIQFVSFLQYVGRKSVGSRKPEAGSRKPEFRDSGLSPSINFRWAFFSFSKSQSFQKQQSCWIFRVKKSHRCPFNHFSENHNLIKSVRISS